MKRLFALLITLFFIISLSACDDKPYDVIENYKIDIQTNSDATLNIEYEIDWKVLISGEEDFLYIGVPNKHNRLISYDNTDIKNAKSYEDEDGRTFIKIYLYKNFKAGDLLKIKFKIHQDYMFTVTQGEEEKIINYSFTPGWFDEIEVKNFTLTWDSENIISTDEKASLIDGKYVWNTKLKNGEKITCDVKYNISSFPDIDITKDSYNNQDSSLDTAEIMFIILFCITIITLIISAIYAIIKNSNSYYSYRGFYVNYNPIIIRKKPGVNKSGKVHINPNNKGSNGSSSGRSCACACACACAGGGRAGCSRKDFYKPKFKTELLDE